MFIHSMYVFAFANPKTPSLASATHPLSPMNHNPVLYTC